MRKKVLPEYALLDPVTTGANLKARFANSNYRIAEIQEYLHFTGPQPIYRWMRGEALPTLHHLCALSNLLGVPVDELLVRVSKSPHADIKDGSPYILNLEMYGQKRWHLISYQTILSFLSSLSG